MHGLTDYITECAWEDIFTVWFVLVDDSFQALYGQARVRFSGPAPRLSDSEVITLSLICDTYFHGHEELGLAFVRQHYLALFPQLLSNSRFNRRRRALSALIEGIRRALSERWMDPEDDLRLIDSAPIPACTYGRSSACATVQGHEYCGYMPSRKAKFFGWHLDLTTTWDQVIDQWMLAPAGPHDSKMGEVLLSEAENLWVLGDTAFRSPQVEQRLQTRRGIRLLAPPQRTVTRPWPLELEQLARRMRRRIESALGVLATVFKIEVPGSRSLSGLVVRVATRILAYTLSFFASAILQPNKN